MVFFLLVFVFVLKNRDLNSNECYFARSGLHSRHSGALILKVPQFAASKSSSTAFLSYGISISSAGSERSFKDLRSGGGAADAAAAQLVLNINGCIYTTVRCVLCQRIYRVEKFEKKMCHTHTHLT